MEGKTCVWEGDTTFTSPTTFTIGAEEFSCSTIALSNGLTIDVAGAQGMLTNMGVKVESGKLKLFADLGSITIDEQYLATAAQKMDTEEKDSPGVTVDGIPCQVQSMFASQPTPYTVSGRFSRVGK